MDEATSRLVNFAPSDKIAGLRADSEFANPRLTSRRTRSPRRDRLRPGEVPGLVRRVVAVRVTFRQTPELHENVTAPRSMLE